MYPGEHRLVAERVYEILRAAPGPKAKAPLAPPARDISGHWELTLNFSVGSARHELYLDAEGNKLSGLHRGRIMQGEVAGSVEADSVHWRISGRYEGADLQYAFDGHLRQDDMEGEADLGEYGKARWTARRLG
jgi:L-seryl-tRNA(Ser) seleniumtransferase